MAARSALNGLLTNDAKLTELGFETVYAQNAVDTPPEDRFIIVRWEVPTAYAFATKGSDRVSIHFHDTDRDYGQIDLGIARLKELLEESVHVDGPDGWHLTTARVTGESADFFDDGFNTVVRWADAVVVSRYDGA